MFSSNTSQVSEDANYIESCFSTWLYTGNGSTQTITNGIDLTGQGGLVWIKNRSTPTNTGDHRLYDTLRGVNNALYSDTTDAQTTLNNSLTAFNSTGFSLGTSARVNESAVTWASWTFRKQPKFFDVVTYTGNGTTNDVAHALDSVPGFVVIKKTSTTSNWYTLNRDSSGNYVQGYLNTTGSLPQVWTSANTSNYLTSTTLKINALATITGEDMNASGTTYVAYLFAHDAGGFGLTGTDNVISCGSFTTDSSGNATINLGYEPQWVMVKPSSNPGGWAIVDSMRGNATLSGTTNTEQLLFANTSGAESSSYGYANPTSTGFQAAGWGVGTSFIYIAIRRGPMKVPTDATKVFSPNLGTANGDWFKTGFPTDLGILGQRSATDKWSWVDRLRGNVRSNSINTDAESSFGQSAGFDSNTGWWPSNGANSDYVGEGFRRAPGFFDVVCYTGTGTTLTLNHNLGVKPELIILKVRSTTQNWPVYHNMTATTLMRQLLNSGTGDPNARLYSDGYGLSAEPTSTTISITPTNTTLFNGTGATYVAYLFASCPGVSKVGSYTGTGTTQVINCGFTGGARFVLIKRTDSTGDWYVWDSARGIVAGNDPYLLLNSTAAEVTNTDYIDPVSSGFEISSTAPAAINASGGSFIFLAIA